MSDLPKKEPAGSREFYRNLEAVFKQSKEDAVEYSFLCD